MILFLQLEYYCLSFNHLSFISYHFYCLTPHCAGLMMLMLCSLSELHSLLLYLQHQSYCLSFSNYSFSFFLFHYTSPLRLSDVNVVFIWSISHIDFAPSSLILLSVIQLLSSMYSLFSVFLFHHDSDLVKSDHCSLSLFCSMP